MTHDPTSDSDLRSANEQLVMSVLRSQALTEVLQARYAQVIGRITEAVVETDAALRITAFSQGAARLYGWAENEAIGCLRDEVMRPAEPSRPVAVKEGQPLHWEAIHRRKDGARVDVSGTTVALRDEAGGITGYLSVVQDLTATRVADELAGELEVARQIQNALLPAGAPDVRGWNVVWRLHAQRSVGGDLVTLAEADEGARYLVADVTGKGISAALSVRTVHQVFHDTMRLPLGAAVAHLNRTLASVAQVYSGVTCVLLEHDADCGVIRMCNAGHPLPLIWRAGGGRVEPCAQSNLVAGWYPDTVYAVQEVELAVGDRLLVYTDGLSDAPLYNDERLDEVGVVDLFAAQGSSPLEDAADRLMDAATIPFQVDDVTLLLLERVAG